MTWLLFFASATLATACSSAPAQAQSDRPARTVTVAEVAKSPEQFLNTSIRVKGKLENASGNFFSRNRRIVLTDGTSSIDVKPWLPFSAPPQQAGPEKPTLASYLDKQVELLGTIRQTEGKNASPAYVLEVKEAVVKTAAARH